MLAKLAICAWALYQGVDFKEMLQEDGRLEIVNVRLKAIQETTASAWAAWSARDANETPQTDETAEAIKVRLIAIEKSVVDATNAERAQYGLPHLEVDGDLMKTAREHCAWMTNNEALQHTQDPVAENIAMGQESPEHVLQSWMGSSGHRANILNGGFRRIGVAAYQTPRGVIFWCQQFQRN